MREAQQTLQGEPACRAAPGGRAGQVLEALASPRAPSATVRARRGGWDGHLAGISNCSRERLERLSAQVTGTEPVRDELHRFWSAAMFYAAMYALKGREDRRAAAALQQMTGVDLGGQPGAPSLLAPRAAPPSWRCSAPWGPQERGLPAAACGRSARCDRGGVPASPGCCVSAPAACSHRWRSLTACARPSPRRGCTSAHHVARLAVEQPDVPRACHRRLWPLWHHLRRQHVPAGAPAPTPPRVLRHPSPRLPTSDVRLHPPRDSLPDLVVQPARATHRTPSSAHLSP